MSLTTTNVGELAGLARSFTRHLRAANRSPRTVTTYLEAVDQLCAFLLQRGMPTTAEGVHREHVEAFVVALQEAGRAPATVSNRFRALQQFFKFVLDEGEIRESPMARDKLTIYDAAYVALAEALGTTLVTADTRLANAPGLRCPVEVLSRL